MLAVVGLQISGLAACPSAGTHCPRWWQYPWPGLPQLVFTVKTYTSCILEQRAESLAAPGNLRPAQLGIVLVGRVTVGHISATLADLAQRGFLRIEEVPDGNGTEWVLTDLRGQGPELGIRLLQFEATLLEGLFSRQEQVQLAGIGEKLIPALDRVRAQLRGDAIRHGRLRRWRRDKRTPHGEQLLRQTQVFRRELRAQALTAGDGIPAALAPYAMIFGLDQASAVSHIATRGGPPDRRDDIEVPRARLDPFAQAWQQVCADEAGSTRAHRSGNTRSDDFAHQWSAPRGHDHGSHGHDAGHGGYDGYGGYDYDGGGHGGFGHAGP